jgi:hypothetical protein
MDATAHPQKRRRIAPASERGIALVMALGMLLVFSVAVAAIIDYSSSSAQASRLQVAHTQAYQLAEAGINDAAAVINNPTNNVFSQSTLPSTQAAATATNYGTGTVKSWGVLSGNRWTLYGLGTVTNPTGGATVQRQLRAVIDVSIRSSQPYSGLVWNSIYSWHTGSTCDMNVANNAALTAPVYVRGNLCINNNGSLMNGPLNVLGTVTLGNNAFVGTSSNRLAQVHVRNGCSYGGGAYHAPCTSADRVWATTSDSNPVDVAPPTADFPYWYANAQPGPAHPCTTSSGTPPVFAHALTSFNLAPAASYTCRVVQNGATIGELSWNSATKVLTVTGAIYIDGSAYLPINATVRYTGMATLYLSGTLWIQNNVQFCAVFSGSVCNQALGAWDPNTTMLVIAANGSGGQIPAGDSAELTNNSVFQGAIYGTNTIEIVNNAHVQGPLAASMIAINNNMTDVFPTIIQVPDGMPGTPDGYPYSLTPPYGYSG